MVAWLTRHIKSRSGAPSWQIGQQRICANRTNRLCLEITASFSKCTSVINPQHVPTIRWSQAQILWGSHTLYQKSDWTLFRVLRSTLYHFFQDPTKHWKDSFAVAEQLRSVAWSDKFRSCESVLLLFIRENLQNKLRAYVPLLNLHYESSPG